MFIFSYSTSLTDDTHEDLINARDNEDNLDEDEDEDEIIDFKLLSNTQPLWVLPLYSLLPSDKQAKVNTCYVYYVYDKLIEAFFLNISNYN